MRNLLDLTFSEFEIRDADHSGTSTMTTGYYPSASASQASSSGLLALQGCVSSLNASLSTVILQFRV
jgi:hypothetical protein